MSAKCPDAVDHGFSYKTSNAFRKNFVVLSWLYAVAVAGAHLLDLIKNELIFYFKGHVIELDNKANRFANINAQQNKKYPSESLSQKT